MLAAFRSNPAPNDLANHGMLFFHLIEDLIHDVVFALSVEPDEHYRFVYVNPGFERATGLATCQVVGRLVDDVIPHPSLSLAKAKYREALVSGTAVHWDEASKYPSGMKVGEVTIRPVIDEASKQRFLVGTVHDITERHSAQMRLADMEERWRLALDASGAAAWDWDSRSNQINFSSQLRDLLGHDPLPLLGNKATLRMLVHPDDLRHVIETRRAVVHGNLRRFVFELRMRHAEGKWVWVSLRGRAYQQAAGGLRVLGTIVDISAEKQAEHSLWHQANHDGLTGLPNRYLLMERIRSATRSNRHHKVPFALLYIDLDEFKEINDTLGHATGDRLLCQVAHRVRNCVPGHVTVARLGGDEFTVLITASRPTPSDDLSETECLAHSILQALAQPFHIDGESVHVSASIGIARFPHDGQDAGALLKHADQALYEAKRLGRNRFAFFRESMQEQAQDRRRMKRDLRRAIRNGELYVLYQPIIDFDTGRVCKAEALLRWNHPLHGTIGPGEFIPLCEETGMIIEIGEWVFKTVVADATRWHRDGWHALKIGVNVSPIQIRHGSESCTRCLSFLASQDLPRGTIVAEVTEGSLLHDDLTVQEQLHRMHQHGIELALDDFGTGYSALSYLQRYTFRFLKIDRSFVHEMETDGSKRALCETIILMAHRLGMQVIAEGVENKRHAELLRLAGCNFGQGFQFSRPVSAQELERLWLKEIN